MLLSHSSRKTELIFTNFHFGVPCSWAPLMLCSEQHQKLALKTWKCRSSNRGAEPNGYYPMHTSPNMLYAFFWVIPRRMNFKCRRFGTFLTYLHHTFTFVNFLTFANSHKMMRVQPVFTKSCGPPHGSLNQTTIIISSYHTGSQKCLFCHICELNL